MAKTEFSERNIFPYDGCSRWGQIKQYLPISREKFRKLSLEGKAPKPIRMGVRCTFYSNKELHKFLENPLNYKWEDLCPTE